MVSESQIVVVNSGGATVAVDDDDFERSGTLLTATAHIVTGVIGSGVLSLAWAIAQLGWAAGTAALLCFALITWYCSTLLADCYRSPDPVHGKRNHTYTDTVRANLGGMKVQLCGFAQTLNLVGVTIAYIITTAISMVTVRRSNCIHRYGPAAGCRAASTAPYAFIFAGMQMALSQLPNFHNIAGLSIVAAAMSFAYSSISLGLSVAKIAANGVSTTSLTGVAADGVAVTASDKLWRAFNALGNMASAFTFSIVLIEIQDTLKSDPPENKVMKRASFLGVSITTVFYMLCGLCGYAAFGDKTPGNVLTGFYKPYWLIDLGNIAIAIHLIGAYQVFSQPIFQLVERCARKRWPNSPFLWGEHMLKLPLVGSTCSVSLFRLTWRTSYVAATTAVATVFPFFNGVLGLVGALSFWPLTVNFPVEMYIAKAKIRRFSAAWVWLKIMSSACLVVSLLAACGSFQLIVQDVRNYHPFKDLF